MPRRIAPSRFRDSLSLAVGGLLVILSGCQGGGDKTAGGTPALTSIAVTPANSLLPEGMTQQMKATGTNSDGSMVDLTATASWSSSTTSVATINAAGLADGVGIGSSTIRATHGSITGTTTLNVNPTVLSQVIQHVVIIFQENRTPDNLFHGFPNADIANSGINSKGQTIPLTPIALANNYDLNHAHNAFVQMYDGGKMDGADKIPISCAAGATGCPPSSPPVKAYSTL